MVTPNSILVSIFQRHLVPQFAEPVGYEPWWWPKSPGYSADDWGLEKSQLAEYASLSRGSPKKLRRRTYEGFVGSVAATKGAAWLLSIRPSAGTFARSVGPLYNAMCNHASEYDSSSVPELHVTDLIKFRGPTAATSWRSGLEDEMLRVSIECLYEEYAAICPPIVLVVDCARAALVDGSSPLSKTSQLRTAWRSRPTMAHLDAFLTDIERIGRPVPFWGQGNQLRFRRAFSDELQGYRQSCPRLT